MSGIFEKHQQNNALSETSMHDHVISGANDSRTGEMIDTRLTQAGSGLVRRLDSAQRNERDPARKMALCLRMAMERDGAPAAYKARQDAILKPRVRVQGGRA